MQRSLYPLPSIPTPLSRLQNKSLLTRKRGFTMANENTPTQKQSQTQYPTTPSRKKKNTKNTRPQVGGTAVSGARSTQLRTVESSNPQQQQYENSNRDMRRRMERI